MRGVAIAVPRTSRPTRLELVLLAVAAAAMLVYWALLGTPTSVHEPRIDRIACVSYAPFYRPGETPFDPTMRVSRERIRSDLQLLSARTGCVRTYSVAQGLDQVAEVARELGMTVLLGAWLGRDRVENARELELAIETVRREPATVRALIVGNEVMLRGELSEDELYERIAQANRALDVPVTYADVWEFWLRHPRLAQAADFVTVHVLPYWEDDPIAVDAAVEHVTSIYRRVQQAFPGRMLLLGETGWPRAGRQRDGAVPGRIEQARFVRAFVDAAADEAIPYNLIEAFDQPWKRRLEGAMGGYWGVLDRAGGQAFPWRGPVNADPRWFEGHVGAAIGSLGFALLALVRRRGTRAVVAQALAGAATGAVLVVQWRHAVQWNEDFISALPEAIGAVLTLAYGWLAVDRLSNRGPAASGDAGETRDADETRDGGDTRDAGIHALVGGLRDAFARGVPGAWRSAFHGDTLLTALRFVFLFAAAATVVLLVFDARYRGFPWASFAVPLGAAVLLGLRGERLAPEAREERLLCVVIWIGAALSLALESVRNTQALVFLASVALYAAACIGLPGSRTSTSMPSSAPIADNPNE